MGWNYDEGFSGNLENVNWPLSPWKIGLRKSAVKIPKRHFKKNRAVERMDGPR
jgi:hypothetical protein